MRLSGVLWILAFAALPLPSRADIVGICEFDTSKLSFRGSATDQAKCLLRPVKIRGAIGETLGELPANLSKLVGKPVQVSRDAIRSHLTTSGLTEADVGGSLDREISRAHGGSKHAPLARYFVIHDTSTPYYGEKPLPDDTDPSANKFSYYLPKKEAHLYTNRLPLAKDTILVMHSLDTPWRATTFEMTVGTPSKGLFIHIENVQARKRDPANKVKSNDNLAPKPGFTASQYEKLALFYVVASRRAGAWMIPAYHAVLDKGIGTHDDPQNFELNKFDQSIGQLLEKLTPQT